MNRQQRRNLARQKQPHMTYADQLAQRKAITQHLTQDATEALIQARATVQSERSLWLCVVSIADAYGFGPKRMEEFFRALEANTRELAAMMDANGEEYAMEKLRRKAEAVCGTKIRLEGAL